MTNKKLHDLIQDREDTKDTIKSKQNELAELNQSIMQEMDEQGFDSYSDADGSATIVRPGKKKKYDWAKLQKLVGRLTWRKIVVEVPSEDLLDQAVARGEISIDQIAQCIYEEDGAKPYVKAGRSK